MKKRALLYNILCWAILYVLWIAVFQNRSFELTRTLTVQFCYLIFIALDYYIILYFIIPKVLHDKGYFAFIGINLLLLSVSAYLRTRLSLFMNVHVFLIGRQQPLMLKVFQESIINIGIWVTVLLCGRMLWDKIKSNKYIASIEHQKTMNELNFLRAQINPHFLFNSLNSVYGNIDRTNKTARTLLLKLSQMLRYQLYECNGERVKMEKEIAYIQNYVDLQKHRKEEDLLVELSADATVNQFEIAPLILVVFIENAFKHVSNFDDRLNKIVISLTEINNRLRFIIWNTTDNKQDNSKVEEGGIGIINVKRRLELIYPNKHVLTINKENGSYEVRLEIELT